MKKLTSYAIVFLAFPFCLAFGSWAVSNEILLDQLGSQHEDVHTQAMKAFIQQGPSAIGILIGQVGGENVYRDKFARRAVEYIADQSTRPGAQEERTAVQNELIQCVLDRLSTNQYNFALSMLSRVGNYKSVPAIATRLRDNETFEMARYALERIGCPIAADALLKALQETACPQMQAALIKTLGVLHYAPAYPQLLKAIKHPNYETRLTAIEALGKLYEPQSLGPLLELYFNGFGRLQRTASEALLDLAEGLLENGNEVRTRKIYSVFLEEYSPTHLRCAALRGFVMLDGKHAWPKLMMAINDDDPQVRGEARALILEMQDSEIPFKLNKALQYSSGSGRLELLRLMIQRNDPSYADVAPLLIQWVKEEKGEVQSAAEKALTQIPGDNVSRAVLYALDVEPAEQIVLIRILGNRQFRGAILRLTQLAQKGEPEIRAAALEALGTINDPISLPVVNAALQDDNETIRRSAAVASLPIATELRDRGRKQEALDLCLSAMKSADNAILRDLVGLLQTVGGEQQIADLARRYGFVTNWWVTGPFRGRESLRNNDPIPMQRMDPTKLFTVDNRSYQWKPYILTNPLGMIDLEQIIGSRNDVGAYLYAHVISVDQQDAVFHIGSDDDFVCWLNETEVGRFIGDRGWNPEGDSLKVTLNKGLNRILLKVLNASGQWAASLRITNTDGNPLTIQQP